VLKRCAVIINNKLDIDTIMPHLLSHNLLTQKDQQFLLNKYHTDHEKVQYLLCQLPRKAEGWFESFLECLRESKQGTGHMEIAKDLEAAKLQNDKELSNMKTDNHLTVPVPVTDDTDVVCLHSCGFVKLFQSYSICMYLCIYICVCVPHFR